jgi:hypothetical protein
MQVFEETKRVSRSIYRDNSNTRLTDSFLDCAEPWMVEEKEVKLMKREAISVDKHVQATAGDATVLTSARLHTLGQNVAVLAPMSNCSLRSLSANAKVPEERAQRLATELR